MSWGSKRSTEDVPCTIDPERIQSECPIYIFADPSHLLKNMRMAFVNSSAAGIHLPDWVVEEEGLPSSFVSIDVLKEVVSFQEEEELLLAPKLKHSTVNPTHFNKMRVFPAKDLFSARSAAAIRVMEKARVFGTLELSEYAGGDIDLNEAAISTAWFLDFMRRLHSLLSSRNSKLSISNFNSERACETTRFLERALDIIRGLRISGDRWKPVQTGYILTINSLLKLSKEMLGEGHKFIPTRCASTDCNECLFSCVRYRDPYPDSLRFRNNLKNVCVSQFLDVKKGQSYDADNHTHLMTAVEMGKHFQPDQDHDIIVLQSIVDLSECDELSEMQELAFYVLAGYVLHTLKNLCSLCPDSDPESCFKELVRDPHDMEEVPDLLAIESDFTGEALVYPSKKAYEFLVGCERIFRELTKNHGIFREDVDVKKSVVRSMLPHTSTYTFKEDCHKIKEKLINRFVSVRLQILANKRTAEARAQEGDGNKPGSTLGSKSMYMRHAADTLMIPNSQRENLEARGVGRELPPSHLREIEGLLEESSLDEAPGAAPGLSSRDEAPSSPGPSFESLMSGSFLFHKK